jgi:hypothetical protein
MSKIDELKKKINRFKNNPTSLQQAQLEKPTVLSLPSPLPEEVPITREEKVVEMREMIKKAPRIYADVLESLIAEWLQDDNWVELLKNPRLRFLTILKLEPRTPEQEAYFRARGEDFDGEARLLLFTPRPFEQIVEAEESLVEETPYMPAKTPNCYYIGGTEHFKAPFGYPVVEVKEANYFLKQRAVAYETKEVSRKDVTLAKSMVDRTIFAEKIWQVTLGILDAGTRHYEAAQEILRRVGTVTKGMLENYILTEKETRGVKVKLKTILLLSLGIFGLIILVLITLKLFGVIG